jgi:phosphatidylglycerophosphatase A
MERTMTPSHWIASGGGIGRFPFAPGTVASLAALPVGALALWLDHRLLALLAIASILVGILAVHETAEQGDPGWIVIDEFAGQWIAMLGLARVSVWGVIAAFVLFRFFDIVKPGPVGWADRKAGAIGVMADDIVAGLIVATILFFATNFFPP